MLVALARLLLSTPYVLLMTNRTNPWSRPSIILGLEQFPQDLPLLLRTSPDRES